MKKINITIAGCLGRMGKIIFKRASNKTKLKIHSVTDVKNNESLGKFKTQKNSTTAFKNTDVIIDFSNPTSTIEILKLAKKLKKKVVIGTTGFNKKQNNLINKFSKKIAIFKSGNMSLGINLLEYIIRTISEKIPNEYQITISDNHHKKKIDYPSGTALMLANAVAKGKGTNLSSITGNLFLNKKGNLKKNKINFFITRKGNTIGKHTVKFNNGIENIEINHDAFSRELFADGALNAAEWINKRNKGLFGMQDMLQLK